MKEAILSCVQTMGLPTGQYCLFGGASLAIRGIRPTDDIDIFVTKKLYDQLKQEEWQDVDAGTDFPYLQKTINGIVCEAFYNCGKTDRWIPKIEEYIGHPETVEGHTFHAPQRTL